MLKCAVSLLLVTVMMSELASVYRDMRCGNIETADGTKLAYVLDQLRNAYETAVLEQRLEDVE